jgi:hypothetical protein
MVWREILLSCPASHQLVISSHSSRYRQAKGKNPQNTSRAHPNKQQAFIEDNHVNPEGEGREGEKSLTPWGQLFSFSTKGYNLWVDEADFPYARRDLCVHDPSLGSPGGANLDWIGLDWTGGRKRRSNNSTAAIAAFPLTRPIIGSQR